MTINATLMKYNKYISEIIKLRKTMKNERK